MVYNDDVAGTIDLILENEKGELILADIKTLESEVQTSLEELEEML